MFTTILKTIVEPEKRKTGTINLLITFLYLSIHAFVAFHHEHWMDEAQAWIIASNLSIKEIFAILCTEGHPCLWFLFLVPFARFGFSYRYFSLISLLIMGIGSFMFLQKSPFSLVVKIGVHLSSVFLFYNQVVCRSYSLIALLIILLASYYRDRESHPLFYGFLIVLLFQSHVLVYGLGIGLVAVLILDYCHSKKRKILIGSFVSIVGLILSIAQIFPRAGYASGIDTSAGGIFSKINFTNIMNGLRYFAYTSWGWTSQSTWLFPYLILVGLIAAIFLFTTINKNWKQQLPVIIVAICSIGLFFGVVILVYTPHAQMASILMMIVLLIMWVLYENDTHLNLRLTVVLFLAVSSFLTFIPAQSSMRSDIYGKYSYSKDAAESLGSRLKAGDTVLIENSTCSSAVYAYLASETKDVFFYDLNNETEYVFHRMGIEYRQIGRNDLEESIRKHTKNGGSVYLLLNSEVEDDRLILIYTNQNEKQRWNESYYIYEVI